MAVIIALRLGYNLITQGVWDSQPTVEYGTEYSFLAALQSPVGRNLVGLNGILCIQRAVSVWCGVAVSAWASLCTLA